MKHKFQTLELTKMALFAALVCVSAYIIIPLPFSPVSLTAQTFIINLMALLLTPRQTAYTLLLYILLGLLGLPVFSGGAGGPGKLFGPTGGYIFSWLIAVPLMSLLKGSRYHFYRYCTVTILVGMPTIYLMGTAYMKILTGMTWAGAFTAAVLPFIPLDLFKCVAAALVAKPVQVSLTALEQSRS
ncbi:MAG: biotin transporter BioY [Clostridium sp.]|nr:biotin transporter BioY [Clostridium sp.]